MLFENILFSAQQTAIKTTTSLQTGADERHQNQWNANGEISTPIHITVVNLLDSMGVDFCLAGDSCANC